MSTDYRDLPEGLPVPVDDGAADHLPGSEIPSVTLPSTLGGELDLAAAARERLVVYVYPRTGTPGVPLLEGWDDIPGARGCTTEACDFRDHHADLVAAGAARVYGVSAQDTEYQREVVDRLHLPFAMLADPDLELAEAIALPTFIAGDRRLYRRLTLIVDEGRVEHVFYPVFPPDEHAREVLAWLRANPA
jgi:peroxiredoxin